METNYIEFKKERDLGTIVTDTFKFIRHNWKQYFSSIIKITGPFILIGAVLIVFFMQSFSGIFSEMENASQGGNPEDIFSIILPMFGWIGLLYIVWILLYILISVTSLFFIKSYINNNGVANFSEVKSDVLKNIWKFIGFGILSFFMIIIGAIFCYLPGIYLGIVFSLGVPIIAFENKSIGDTISHCFALIKTQWWNTFGVLIVVGILVWLLGMIFSIPSLIYQLTQTMTQVGEEDPTKIFELFADPVYLVLQVVSYLGQFLLSSITLIASVFIYFDLNEQKNLTGTSEQIDRLGSL